MLGMDFLKEQRCVIDNGKDLIQFPMQSDFWCLCLCRVVACTPCLCAVSIGSLHHENNDKFLPLGTIVWRFLMVTCIYQTLNVSENDESANEQVSENLDSCIERTFLSQRQCRLIYQQLRISDSCLGENFSALMHGHNSDGRVCVFLRSAQHVILP